MSTRHRSPVEAGWVSLSTDLAAPIALSLVLAVLTPASAQQQLPGIVVRGATLDPPPLKTTTPAAEEDDTPPVPQPKALPKTLPKQTAAPQPKQTAPTAPSTAPGPVAIGPVPQGPPGAVTGQGPAGAEGAQGGESDGIAGERTGTPVTVVTRADLERRQVRTGAEALRSLPGVSVSRQGVAGSLTQVRIRGNEGNHTLVLIDGIEANDATNGEFDFSDLAVADIERIEVLRGPQSGLYGSGAAGGVINIITRSGRGPLRATATAEAGGYETRNVSAQITGGSERVWGALSASHLRTDGFNIAPSGSERDGTKLTTVGGRVGVLIADGLVLNLSGRRSVKQSDYDEFGCDFDPVTFGCRNGRLGTAYDAFNVLDHQVSLLGANLQWDMLEGRLTHVFKASLNETERRDRSASFGFSQNRSERRRYGYQATARLDQPAAVGSIRHFLTGLIEREDERFTPSSDFGFGFAADGIDRTRGQTAFAAEWRAEIANQLFLAATARRDDTTQFGPFDTWRTSLSWKIPTAPAGIQLRPHASIGTAIKLPTLFEQFGSIPGSFTPNPNLEAERIKGWDAGVEFGFAGTGLSLDVTYFNMTLEDKIASRFLPNFTSTAVNLDGTSTREGVEFAARWAMTPSLELGAAYTYTRAQTPEDLPEVRRPPHTARGDITWFFAEGRGTLSGTIVYNGDVQDVAFSNATFASERVLLDAYVLAGIAASYKLTPGLEVFGRVENAFNDRYQEVFGYEAAGAAAYAGIKVTLGGK
jgi:vitamin B12 transporter